MKKVVMELDKILTEGEIIVYEEGKLKSEEIHRLLPDLKKAKSDIEALQKQIAELKQTIANLAKIVKEK